MLQKNPATDNFKRIDQMLEDFAGDEVDEFDIGVGNFEKNHKHYSAEEDALLDIDDLY